MTGKPVGKQFPCHAISGTSEVIQSLLIQGPGREQPNPHEEQDGTDNAPCQQHIDLPGGDDAIDADQRNDKGCNTQTDNNMPKIFPFITSVFVNRNSSIIIPRKKMGYAGCGSGENHSMVNLVSRNSSFVLFFSRCPPFVSSWPGPE
jgi:hypothetical protein